MRVTDKAAEASLPVPEGLSPSLIGKVVIVNIFKKVDGEIHPDILIKHVGVLKSYSLTAKGLDFVLDGTKSSAYYSKLLVVFSPFEGS